MLIVNFRAGALEVYRAVYPRLLLCLLTTLSVFQVFLSSPCPSLLPVCLLVSLVWMREAHSHSDRNCP